MWKLFKYRRWTDAAKESDTSARHRIAEAVAKHLLTIQKRWSVFMQTRFERLSLRMKRLVLLSFMLSGVLLCGYWLWVGISLKSAKTVPRTTNPTFSPQIIQDEPVAFNLELYRKLQYIRKYLDSTTVEGRNMRARLNKERPGLLDSIAFIERAYEKYKEY